MDSPAEAMSLAGRHALVCGASSGIGRAAAEALAALGAEVTLLARSDEKLALVARACEAAGAPAARAVRADMDDRPAFAGILDGVLAEHPAQVLIHNTGGPPPGPILEAGDEDFLRAFGRHVLCGHLLVKRVLPAMREAGFGRIINVISTSVREPIPGLGVSNTIRGAVASWAKTLAGELPPSVTINNVLPGYTATERLASLGELVAERSGRTIEEVRDAWVAAVPERRLGRPEELGQVIAFLASPAASYIRGQSLAVDGGRMHCI